jgi:RHS repeat-associated protein
LPAVSSTVSTYVPALSSDWMSTDLKDAFNAVRHSAGAGGTAAPPPNGTTRYTYDIRGNLVAVTRNGVMAEQLAYGPAGELLYRQVGEKFIFYVGEYMTVRASGATGCASIGACAPLLATVEADYHVLLASTRIVSISPSRTLYYYRSRLGTVVATSLAGGVLGAQYRYDPYGKLQVALNETAATASEYGYTNALRLTGDLWHLKARVYDAAARVFLQADSVDRYRYAYVWGDPVNLSDPTGLLPVNIVWEGMETSGSLYATLGGMLMDGHWSPGHTPERSPTKAEDARPPPTPEAEVEKENDNGNGAQAEEDTKKPAPAAGLEAPKTEAEKDTKRQQFVFIAQEKHGKRGYESDSRCRWMCNDLVSKSVNDAGEQLRNGSADYIRDDPHLKTKIEWGKSRTGDIGFVVRDSNGEVTHIMFVDKRPGMQDVYTTFGYPAGTKQDGTPIPAKLGNPSGTAPLNWFVGEGKHVEVRRYDWP